MDELRKMTNNNKLSKDDIKHLYGYLCLYESELKVKAGSFNMEDDALYSFLKERNIYIGAQSKKDKKKANSSRNFILYCQRKNNISGTDKVHHLLRHIRNAIAHGLITKGHNQIMTMTDKSTFGNETMQGKINAEDFYALLNLLIKTRQE